MGYLSVFRAIAVRLMFTAHGVISIWRLTTATREPRYWYLAVVLCLLLVEMTITLGKKAGKEWKWFCPSVFIYLMCIVPTIWFLKLHELEKKLECTNSTMKNCRNESTGLEAPLGNFLGAEIQIKIAIDLDSDEWIRLLEQLLLLILIMGRWILPKGKLTHDQLSQLLLVYIGTAADIVEFFEAFKEEKVSHNRMLCIIILGIWSLSLIQFSLVLTASRVRRDRSGLIPFSQQAGYDGCCNADVYGIIISILLQDLPFLIYTNMFFTCKNTIVIVLLIYRLIVVQVERKRLAMAEVVTPDGPPRYCSSPAIFDHNVRRNKGRMTDSISLSNSNTLSTCSTKCSNKSTRTVKPFSSCSNIYEVKATASTRNNNSYNQLRVMDDLHSPV
ncbi:unnamed protein product [Candidula unifasciata]|uniref:Transmembrane protein 26 n=1 Tax=Candidula unifasciata TaxID=100452 RepID=A0A8S3ZBV8_9EUPU|nr:unnamed protein product [Candidula unifasciata]